jgi:hypothetical protein
LESSEVHDKSEKHSDDGKEESDDPVEIVVTLAVVGPWPRGFTHCDAEEAECGRHFGHRIARRRDRPRRGILDAGEGRTHEAHNRARDDARHQRLVKWSLVITHRISSAAEEYAHLIGDPGERGKRLLLDLGHLLNVRLALLLERFAFIHDVLRFADGQLAIGHCPIVGSL